MSIKIGFNDLASIDATRVMSGDGTSSLPTKVVAGDGSAVTEIWPGKRVYRDEFELVNSYLGANWNVVGTSPWLLFQNGGAAMCFGNTTDGNRPSQGVWKAETATWSQYCKAELASVGSSGLGTWLQVHSREDSDSYMGLQWNDSVITMFNAPGGGAATINRGSASEARGVGKVFELRAEQNPTTGIFTYRALVNDVQRITWTDSSNIVPKPSTNKKCGWGSRTNRSFGSTKYAPSLAWWEAGDI